jgi:acyl carrier protein
MATELSQAVVDGTRQILADSLGLPSPQNIELTAYVKDDLGAESIDFLDIFQQAELRFGIRINQGDFAPELRPPEDDQAWEADINRELTPAELQKLKDRLPTSTHDRIRTGLHVYDILRLVTVEALAAFFQTKVNQLAQPAGA